MCVFAEGLDADNCLPIEDSGYASAAAAAVDAAAAVQQNYYYNKTTTQDHSFQVYSETRAAPAL